MDLSKETRDRIFAAADSLYDQAGRANFPTVDAVRKTAKVNMNDASAGMKEWRRAQTAQAAPVAIQVPDVVQQASSAALAVLWHEAQELANESLRAAQAGWEVERGEADTLNRQMADAYETQAAELEAAQAEISQLKASATRAAAEKGRVDGKLEDTCRELTAANAATERANAKIIEIERRATELRTELDHAHQEAVQARAELAGVREAHGAEIKSLRVEIEALQKRAETAAEKAATMIDALRAELVAVKTKAEAADQAYQEQRKRSVEEIRHAAERMTKTEAERNEARKLAGAAREDAAKLRGQVETLQKQASELMRVISGHKEGDVKAEVTKSAKKK